jgi:hypothetical protein
VLGRLDAIPQPGGLLVAEALGQVRAPLSEAREEPAVQSVVWLWEKRQPALPLLG